MGERLRRRVRAGLRAARIVVVVGVVGVATIWMAYPRLAGPGDGMTVEITIPRGAGPRSVGRILQEANVVRSGRLFAFYLRLSGATPRLRSGRHSLRDDATPTEVLARIARPAPGSDVRVTIPEGLDLHGVAALLEESGVAGRTPFLAAARDRKLLEGLGVRAESAEGYLFPDTYELRVDASLASAARTVRRMVQNFHRKTAAALGALEPDRRHEVVVLASIVEREAKEAAERPRIAAVFHNRLDSADFRPRVLQADPTVAYGCRVVPTIPSCAGFSGRLTRRQLDDPANPYNTYVHEGLPPGPISNPGLPSIHAALHPARTDELYFVARGDGTHAFARTLEEHNRNVRRYRRR